jgi:NADH:ubiquinone oxidoreductase subunit F (NADH-binding)
LLESLEGKRGNPRNKPPFPAVKGLYGCPTVVNNVETIAAVTSIVNNGGEEYAKIGIGKSTGTKLISACGHLKRPGVYEIELGVSVEEFFRMRDHKLRNKEKPPFRTETGGLMRKRKSKTTACYKRRSTTNE